MSVLPRPRPASRAARTWLLPALVAVAVGCARSPAVKVVVAQPVVPTILAPNARLEEFSLSVLFNVFEPLVSNRRDLAVEAGLAESWQNPDPRTWVFTLRPGVTLHDGRPLDARLVAESMMAEVRGANPGHLVDVQAIESVVATDPRTVVVRSRIPVVNALTFQSVSLAFPPRTPGGFPVGTGPFRIESVEPGRRIRLAAFEGYWGRKPQLDTLEFVALPEPEARLRALETGAADLAVDVPDDLLPRARGNPRLRLIEGVGLRVVFLAMRCTPSPGGGNPLVDVRTRRAVAASLDRGRLVREVFGGRARPSTQIVPPEIYGHVADIPEIPFDPDLARREVAATGAARAGTLRLDYPVGRYRSVERVAEGVARDLRRVGLDVAVRGRPSEEFLESPDPATLLWLIGWMSTRDAGISYDYLVHTPAHGLGSFNWMGYSNPDVDRELDAFRVSADPSRNLDLLGRVGRQLARDVPAVGLYQAFDVYAADRNLVFNPRPDRRILGVELAWTAPR